MSKYSHEEVKQYLDKNPDGFFSDFVKKTGSKMVPSNFSMIKTRYFKELAEKPTAPSTPAAVPPVSQSTSKTPAAQAPSDATPQEKRTYAQRRKSPHVVYSRLWFHSLVGMPKEAKDIVTNLVEQLNYSGVANLEVVELANPSQLEVREYTK